MPSSTSVVPTVTGPIEQPSETKSCIWFILVVSNLLAGFISTGVFAGVVVGLIAVILVLVVLVVLLATVLLIVIHKNKMSKREHALYTTGLVVIK